MNIEEIDILSMENLLKIKGGIWCYDSTTDTWYWIGARGVEPKLPLNM